jgi:FlaA1/EpsC-like NDP-sugar epimerase
VLAPTALLAGRLAARLARERRTPPASRHPRRRALVVGAGVVANALLRDLALEGDRAPIVLGLIDDDPNVRARLVQGVAVLGTTVELEALAHRLDPDMLIVASDLAPARLRHLHERATRLGMTMLLRTGGIAGGASETGGVVRVLEVADLVRAAPVALDGHAASRLVSGRTVLVTGAGGTTGAAVCRRLAGLHPARIVLVDRDEGALATTERELARLTPMGTTVAVVADVTDRARMDRVLAEHGPVLVVHAATLNNVPLLESNVAAAVTTNVLGTANLVDACLAGGVMRVVLVSSDKAVAPISVMGATLRLAERLVAVAALASARAYVSVRAGTIVDAPGGVVRVIEEQVARGGPVTVTHPDMERVLVTADDVAALVLTAAAHAGGAEAFVPRGREPVRIVELAHHLIRLAGREPERDVPIEITGARPGERLRETPVWPDETVSAGPDASIAVARPRTPAWPDAARVTAELARLAAAGDEEALRVLLLAEAGASTLAEHRASVEGPFYAGDDAALAASARAGLTPGASGARRSARR